MVNKQILLGFLGNDPEIREVGQNKVANLSVATTEKWKGKDGQMQEETTWHKVNFWGRQAEICESYLHKGSQVYIEGSTSVRKWQDNEGVTKYSHEVKGRVLTMLGNKGDNNSGGGKQQDEPWPDNTYVPNDGTGSDVPF